MASWKKHGYVPTMLLLLALLSISLVDAQSPKPVISFEADKHQVAANEQVTLAWDFKNVNEAFFVWPGGKQEVLYGPGSKTVVFPGPGDYTVMLGAVYEGGEKQISIIFRVTGPQPQPVCTPPPCPAGGVLRCPEGQQCPGGCGVICVAPTRTWWVRGTVSDSIVGAALANVIVNCQGGSVLSSTRSLDDGTFDLTWEAPAEARPDGKCTTQLEGYHASEVVLGTAGADGSYQLQLALNPAIPQGDGEWAINYVATAKTAELGQSLGTVQEIAICSRKFEAGAMLWRSGDKRSAIVPLISPTGRFFLLDDSWDQQSIVFCPPPNVPGLYLPDRGLGWAWCTNQSMRDALGYSTEPQEVCDGPELGRMRDYRGGRLVWVPSWNKVIYLRWNGGLWYEYDFSP